MPAGALKLKSSDSRGVFVAAAALVFLVSAVATVLWSTSMPAMDMPMPGGWTMSMAWMPMPGQSWVGMGISFIAMWAVMMPAMMLPSLVPMLWRYRETLVERGGAPAGWLTFQAGLGYFLVWIL